MTSYTYSPSGHEIEDGQEENYVCVDVDGTRSTGTIAIYDKLGYGPSEARIEYSTEEQGRIAIRFARSFAAVRARELNCDWGENDDPWSNKF